MTKSPATNGINTLLGSWSLLKDVYLIIFPSDWIPIRFPYISLVYRIIHLLQILTVAADTDIFKNGLNLRASVAVGCPRM